MNLPRPAGHGALLRRLSVHDLAAFQAYRSDPEVGRWQGWTPTLDAQALAFLQDMSCAPLLRPGQWSQIAIADARSGALLGDIGLHLSEDASEVEIGFSLARPHQGRGVATQAVASAIAWAFEASPAQRVFAQTDTRNRACIQLLQRLQGRLLERIATEFRGKPCVELRFLLAERELGLHRAAPPPSA